MLQPQVFVHNTTAKNISAEMVLNWHGPSASGQAKLPELQIAPFATQQVQIGAMQQLLQIPDNAHWALVSLTTDAMPDDLIAIASSRDKTGRYGVEANFSGGPGGAHFAGGEWRTDAEHNEVAAITNIGTKSTDALLTLYYDHGKQKYELQKTIASGDQMWVNLAQLVRQRVPDRKGNTLPIDVSSVTYDLRDLTESSHSLTVDETAVDRTWGPTAITQFPVCGCGLQSVGIDPGEIDIIVNGLENLGVYGADSCGNGDILLTNDFTSWGSNNTAVANQTKGKVVGVGPGSTDGYADGIVCYDGCACHTYDLTESVSVPNSTPILTGIDPSDWPSGATTPSVVFSGQYFGTNPPTLSFSPSAGIGYGLVSYNDTQIVANITVAQGTPTEEVKVSVTNNGYGGVGFQSGGGLTSPTSAPVFATVRAPLNSPEITIIAWVNGSAPDLNPLPVGENSTLKGNLQNGTSSQQAACAVQVGEWVLGIAANIVTDADRAYANAWLLVNSANAAPPSTITPSAQLNGGNYRLFNDFGGSGLPLGTNVGYTPDPCKTGLLDWAGAGQPSQYEGYSSTSPAGQVYQIAEGRIGTAGQAGSETINGRTVPWIWSAIEFNSANGTPNYSPPLGTFPTYYLYVNGTLTYTFPQSTVAAFIAHDQTYQLTPSQIP
jgi:hypothetical protein